MRCAGKNGLKIVIYYLKYYLNIQILSCSVAADWLEHHEGALRHFFFNKILNKQIRNKDEKKIPTLQQQFVLSKCHNTKNVCLLLDYS